MKRLTEWDEFDNADIIGVDSCDFQFALDYERFNRVTDALNRLAAYEDSGLTPERAAELGRKEHEGLLVVLPDGLSDEEKGLVFEVLEVITRALGGEDGHHEDCL